MESDLPNFDLPSDYMVGEGYGINLLKRYKKLSLQGKSRFFHSLCKRDNANDNQWESSKYW